jgi:hypothetical protein
MVLEILVRARPRWILERLEVGRWPESVWQEAFERRYLPSWKAFKKDDDSWRAVFLRWVHCTFALDQRIGAEIAGYLED